MFDEALQEAINKQINREFHAAYSYLAMSVYFEALNLEGFAQWMRHQSQEELGHAMKFVDYVNDRGGRVILQGLNQPTSNFGSTQEVFERALQQEQSVTGAINELYRLAQTENDYPTQVLLHWFIEEQVEEEKTIGTIIEQIKRVGSDPAALFLLDRELGKREDDE